MATDKLPRSAMEVEDFDRKIKESVVRMALEQVFSDDYADYEREEDWEVECQHGGCTTRSRYPYDYCGHHGGPSYGW